MSAADWPLRDEPLSAVNAATEAFVSQDSSDGMESLHLLDHLDSPHLTLHDFHKFQHSPVLASSPELEYRCVRRKASTADLTTAHTRYTDPALYNWPNDVVWTPSMILPRTPHATSHSNFLPSSLHYRPLTPRPRTYTASPSLSSTVDTIQSSPFQTPVNQGRSRVDYEGDEQSIGFIESIRTKRKFDSLKRAKRLPHSSCGISTGQSELWEVYAAVFSLEENIEQVGGQAELRKGNSLRFEAAICKEASVSRTSVQELEEERRGHPTSSASLKRLDWPLPPSHDSWKGTFGHLNTSTPLSTPATVLYRGASFDVLNPHASLVLQSHDLETPAEIDGLLDSYFEDHNDNTQDNMQNNTATGDSSPTSSYVPSESSRRVLYDNAEIAHRNILGTRAMDKTQVTPPPRALLSASGSQNEARPFSDPFDLTVSENGSSNTLLTINHVLKEGRRNDAVASPRMQPLGLGITDPDETHATSDQTTNPTIKAILYAYDYTRVRSSQLEDLNSGTSPTVEQGRCDPGQQPKYESSNGLLSPLQTPECQRSCSFGTPSNRFCGPAPLPTPPQPIYSGISKPAVYYTDCSDLPTTDQSYGNTNHLLNITPEVAVEIPPYEPYEPCHPATCADPAHIHPYEADADVQVTPSEQYFEHDDKENIVPDDYCSPGLAAIGMHGDQNWRFKDDDSDDNDGDLGRAMPRSSSFYPDDGQSCWITEADPSQINLRDMQRFSGVSADSYANTSFVESQHRFSFQPLSETPPLSPVQGPPPAMNALDAVKRDGSIKNIEDRRFRAIEAQIDQLQSKIAQEQVASGYTGSPKIDGSQRRADLAELERLRNLLPATSRPFVFKANESAETVKPNPPPKPPKLQKAQTFVRPQYLPKTKFSHVLGLGQHESAFNSGSDTRGLLASPITPSPYTNLGYSESTGTFMTVQQESPLDIRGPATNLWSPFDKDPTNRAIHVKPPIGKKPIVVDIELGPVGSNSKRSHRAAIGSQYEPRELHLIKQKRFTDAQLVARSPGWTILPSNRDFVGHYAESSVSTYPMLRKPKKFMDQATRVEQKRISKRYAYPCYAFPPLALAFGLGLFDGSIAKRTNGRVKEACPKEKRRAYMVGFPLGMIFWGVFVISVYLMVTLIRPSKESGSPIA